MNPVIMSSLSAKEIIQYVESGVLESIDTASVMKVVDYLREQIPEKGEPTYDSGYDDGYQEAIRDAVHALNNL